MEYGSPFADPEGVIARSWRRCLDAGLDASAPLAEPAPVAGGLAVQLEANARLVAYAQPMLEGLHRHLARSSSIVLLADQQGMILRSVGEAGFVAKAARVHLRPGALWSEGKMGTNAIGTALMEEQTVEVIGGQHFLERNRFLTCISAPILAPGGGILGVIDISGDARVAHTHAAALVEMAAAIIENRLIETLPGAGLVLHVHTAAEALGTPLEGLAAFSEDGRLLASNRRARVLFPDCAGAGNDFARRFSTPWPAVVDHANRRGDEALVLRTWDGGEFVARVGLPRIVASRASVPALAAAGGDGARTLTDLGSDDPRMAEAIRRAIRIAECDIPLLIQGETGSGKEWFAQAFHNSTSRRGGPFVAVNCAAIPATLIEAELFGYVDGAFTGARRVGTRGKIREADGGTLFLDEIGDMPLALQAVLLRVLETRRVTPLGGGTEEAVDTMLVCASHQPLRELVGTGRFRADLFFRLSGMTVSLPSLRERCDFDCLVRRVLAEEGGTRPVRLTPEAFAVLRRYSWPGNLRQLRNVLRLSVALLAEDGLLTPDLLPPEILGSEGGDLPPRGLRAVQSRLVRETVERHGGNISAAARELGITRTTLYRKLGMERNEARKALSEGKGSTTE